MISCSCCLIGRSSVASSILISSCAGFQRSIQQTAVSLPASPSITAYWSWNEKRSNYVLYGVEAIVDIELAYQKRSHGVKKSIHDSVDLSKCKSRLPYTLNFITMEQTRHSYGTKRKVQRVVIPGGHSLQSLLQSPPSVANTLSSVAGTSGSFSFSGFSGPATSLLMSGATGRGPPTSVHSATIDLTSASGEGSAPVTGSAKPPSKKKPGRKGFLLGRGGKNKSKSKTGSKITILIESIYNNYTCREHL